MRLKLETEIEMLSFLLRQEKRRIKIKKKGEKIKKASGEGFLEFHQNLIRFARRESEILKSAERERKQGPHLQKQHVLDQFLNQGRHK